MTQTNKVEVVKNNKYSINIGMGGWFTIQIILLVLFYGDIVIMPLWLVWLPSIVVGVILCVLLIVLLIILLVAVVAGIIVWWGN